MIRKNTQLILIDTFKNHFFLTFVEHIISMTVRKWTSSCWKILDKKRLTILEYFDAYICHHSQPKKDGYKIFNLFCLIYSDMKMLIFGLWFILHFSYSTWYLIRLKFYIAFDNKLIDSLNEGWKIPQKDSQNIQTKEKQEPHTFSLKQSK